MAVQKTASGKVDKRTKEYKEMVERAQKARATQKKTTSTVKNLLPQRPNVLMGISTNEQKNIRRLQNAWQKLARQKIV